MEYTFHRPIVARLFFIIGLLFMLSGTALLLGTFLAGSSRVSVLAAFFVVLLGSGCAVFAIKLKKRSLYLFFATFFILVGFFLFLFSLNILPISFSAAWPLISVFAGLALFPSGWYRYGAIRPSYLVSSLAFAFLGCILLIFSLNMVPFSFTQFILRWWPLLVVLAGIILFLLSLGTKHRTEVSR